MPIDTATPLSTYSRPPYQDILQHTSAFIFDKYSSQAPDFSNLVVLLPHSQVTPQFNEALCRSLNTKTPAIIPPWAGTLKAWTMQSVSNQHANYQIISEYARQLLFIEALQQYPNLFKEENKWQVTQALLSLFDELSLNQTNFFATEEELQQRLQQAYGTEHEHLLYESKLVYTLWHAWQKQLHENKLYDETADYLSRLKHAHTAISAQQQFICLGQSQYTETERQFINHLVNNKQCHIIDYASAVESDNINTDTENENVYADFIRESFTQSTLSIKQRALRFSKNHPDNTADDIPFSTYLANNEEAQLRAIDYYIRLKVLDGKNNIAIICEDRKISRRLRALLERANIPLQDRAGWSLATTQAATIIERWLECIEEDFSAYALLDCLKSPFIDIESKHGDNDDTFRKNIYRFEHDLIFHENVSSNIDKYKAKLKERLNRLSHWPTNSYDELTDTLTFIQQTAKRLRTLHSENNKLRLSTFLEALIDSLHELGVLQGFQRDDAGLLLLNTFASLKQSISHADPTLSWNDCRLWLGMAFESQHFTPVTKNTSVQLMTLEQASHCRFDCIIFAAVETQHFPGSAHNLPFFNQAVRASLGLTTWEMQREQRFELFSRTLMAAPDILLTACNEEKGEEKPVSPWLELLVNFYQLSFDKKSENLQLQHLVRESLSNIHPVIDSNDDAARLEQSTQPAPPMPVDSVPTRISASAYQRIINCPYQYFSADALQLKPLEELSDELKKSDYGERIHTILQSFHNGHKKYGKAFSHIISEVNRKEAQQFLEKLSKKVFSSDLDNNVLHRSWLYRWQKHIPSYINWQIQHQLDWSIYLCEEHLEIPLNIAPDESVTIYGRLDRIDQNKENNTHTIIDYKTGKTAKQDDVYIGENVQLSTYALLDSEASEVSHLSIDSSKQKVETKSFLSDENLTINREQNKQRLIKLFSQMKKKHPMHAWGDVTVCRYCHFSGLCRKAEWHE
ncbi:MAG: PD-(D/E)XK nuclease family protein [Gammaproteobacteria bacterium]|nr:PD-(D/E)XK nuclease family protein [Gammaproteobacteria bacterium]